MAHGILNAPFLRCLLCISKALFPCAEIGAHDGRLNPGLLHHIEWLSCIDGT